MALGVRLLTSGVVKAGLKLAGHVPGQSTMFFPLMSCHVFPAHVMRSCAKYEANGLAYPANTNDLAMPLLLTGGGLCECTFVPGM